MQDADSSELVAKRLATGEVAVWDGDQRVVYIVSDKPGKESLRVIKGATLKEIEDKLGHVVVLN